MKLAKKSRLENLVKSSCYSNLSKRLDKESFEQKSKGTLLEHLEKNKDLRHSLSWYASEAQALKFAKLMESGNENHNLELELIRKVFSNNYFFEGDPVNNFISLSIVDIGCGSGEKIHELIDVLNEDFKHKIINFYYYPVDGSPYFTFLTLARLSNNNNITHIDSDSYGNVLRVATLKENKFIEDVVTKLEKVQSFCESLEDFTFRNKNYFSEENWVLAFGKMSYKFAQRTINKRELVLPDHLKGITSENIDKFAYHSETRSRYHLCKENPSWFDRFTGYNTSQTYFIHFLEKGKTPSKLYKSQLKRDFSKLLSKLRLMKDHKVIDDGVKRLIPAKKWIDWMYSAVTHEDPGKYQVRQTLGPLRSVLLLHSGGRSSLKQSKWDSEKSIKAKPLIQTIDLVGDIFDKDLVKKIGYASISNRYFNFTIQETFRQNLNLLLGQTLGNFDETGRKEILSNIYEMSKEGSHFVIGVELRPYSDSVEECEEIGKKYEGGNFFLDETVKLLGEDPGKLKFRAQYVFEDSEDLIERGFEVNSVAMWYECLEDVTFSDGRKKVILRKDEIIPAASSYKFSPGEIDEEGNYSNTELEELCESVGFKTEAIEVHLNDQGRPDYMVLMVKK